MTLIEQQRLMGAVLLLLMISVISYFLISGANTGAIETESVQIESTFTSVVQPLVEDELEVIEYAEETLLDPQNLGQIVDRSTIAADIETLAEQEDNIDTVSTTSTADSMTPKWVLQLGSFSVKTNAEALASQLITLGFTPSVESSTTDKGMIYRVRLLPMENKTTAKNLADELAKKLNLKPQVLQQKS